MKINTEEIANKKYIWYYLYILFYFISMWNLDKPASSPETIKANKNPILDKISQTLQKEKTRRIWDEYHRCIMNRRVLLCEVVELNDNERKIPNYIAESQDKILTELSPHIDYNPSEYPNGFQKLADMTNVWGVQVLPDYGWKTPAIKLKSRF